jgi:putative transposase
MPRSARLVFPDIAHHVIQRGNRQQPIVFSDDDRRAYVEILGRALQKHETRCLAWCLMDNHIHLILVPKTTDGLRAPLASAHTTYSQLINRNQNVSGHLFQGRFLSYPMDDAHMMVAARYIENNPVKAGMVARAEDWAWSSARAHITGHGDKLADVRALGQHVPNWRAMLAEGLEAGDQIEGALRTGAPLGEKGWRAALEASLGRSFRSVKRGRPAKATK